MKRDPIRLGDTVSGTYHGVPFTGDVHAYDASGYVYVRRFQEPLVVYGIKRDGIGIHPDSEEMDSLRVVACPIDRPEVFYGPSHGLGGAYIR